MRLCHFLCYFYERRLAATWAELGDGTDALLRKLSVERRLSEVGEEASALARQLSLERRKQEMQESLSTNPAVVAATHALETAMAGVVDAVRSTGIDGKVAAGIEAASASLSNAMRNY